MGVPLNQEMDEISSYKPSRNWVAIETPIYESLTTAMVSPRYPGHVQGLRSHSQQRHGGHLGRSGRRGRERLRAGAATGTWGAQGPWDLDPLGSLRQWIGVNIYRKPWSIPLNIRGSCKFSLKPIQ